MFVSRPPGGGGGAADRRGDGGKRQPGGRPAQLRQGVRRRG